MRILPLPSSTEFFRVGAFLSMSITLRSLRAYFMNKRGSDTLVVHLQRLFAPCARINSATKAQITPTRIRHAHIESTVTTVNIRN